MLLNYWVIIILVLGLPVYYSLSRLWQNLFLICASYLFYAYWDYRFIALIIISTLLNYYLILRIHSSKNHKTKRAFIIICLIMNLGILGFFKYYNFFISSFVSAFQMIGIVPHLQILKIILPLGISFYTFKIIGYVIDIYRENQTPSDFQSFALFVAYFPEIMAGPIDRAGLFMPQVSGKRVASRQMIFAAFQLILLGFFKKKVIADALTPYVDQVFSDTTQLMSIDLLFGMYLYTLQIYADFSGYTDIVRGISKFFGIEIPENFRQPYLSKNVNEFWRRWHISLSSWLRDYLYIPLGGSRKGNVRTYVNLLVTMLLCGLWHGASWVFVLWGGIHGIYLSVYRFFKDNFKDRSPAVKENLNLMTFLSIILTFHLVGFAWIFFRAPDFDTAYLYVTSMFTLSKFGLISAKIIYTTFFYMALTLAIDLPLYKHGRELLVTSDTPWPWRSVVYALLILSISFLGVAYVKPFIYFQF